VPVPRRRGAPLAYTWVWERAAWRKVAEGGYRYQPIMVFDRARGKTVLYGGIQGSKDDTWEWDGARWKQIHP
jgi:hypothetical protein